MAAKLLSMKTFVAALCFLPFALLLRANENPQPMDS